LASTTAIIKEEEKTIAHGINSEMKKRKG